MPCVDRNLAPVEVTEKKSVLQFEITREKVPRRELMHFSRQLAVFMKAGIPVLEALEVLSEEVGSKNFQRILAEMSDSLRSGETFASAAEAHPEAFPPTTWASSARPSSPGTSTPSSTSSRTTSTGTPRPAARSPPP